MFLLRHKQHTPHVREFTMYDSRSLFSLFDVLLLCGTLAIIAITIQNDLQALLQGPATARAAGMVAAECENSANNGNHNNAATTITEFLQLLQLHWLKLVLICAPLIVRLIYSLLCVREGTFTIHL